MSYNGSGTFNINSSGQPVVTGTVISSTAFNALTADLGTGLSTAITKDGQTVATARIPFAAGINSSLVTDATSTTTGSIITAGGVGVAKALFVGTTANIAGTTTLAGVTATSITDSGLTSGRVTFASTAGLLADAAALAWDGTSLSATKFSGALNGTVGATTPAAGAFTTGTFSSTLDVTGAATLTTLRATTGGSVHPIQYDGSATNRAIIQSDNGTIILFDIAGSIIPTLPLISGLTLPFQITVALAAGAGGTIVLTRSGTNNISFNAVSQATATTIVHGSTLTLAANSTTGRWITLGINGTWT